MKLTQAVVFVACLLVVGTLFLGTNGGAQETVLSFGHYGAPTDTATKAAEHFAELVEERTNGQLTITLHPGNELGNSPTQLQGVRIGTIDLVMVGNPYLTAFAPELNVLDLPFLFTSCEHAYNVLDGAAGRRLLDTLEKYQLKGLAFWEIGFRNISNSSRPIHSPEDLKGLKIRTTPNPAHVLAFKLLGANPTPMPFAELYMALQTKTVDGQENPVHHIYASRLHEVQNYLSLTNHAYTVAPLVMNLAKFQSLTAENQKILVEAALESAKYERELNSSLNGESLAKMKAEGIEVVEEPDIEAFRSLVIEPVWKAYVEEYGSDILDEINKD
ncbi:hypothetical protein CSB45_14165 [candidate division KSB3 bacterium]|uniref:ABC transporter substrate-binding protein n=1 Tax=candidate division KSB3 bacterium TaxID=2044937 RepID=A0A2G6E268_9BACT|nr:MAG: hypothetical protein CSB45_14165 [candidate division KSB3 bacterium]PIE28471.1 MAG: hypothetical protein CSA57_13810 [candidate division KSB3 bacterium]